ncbi:uncharacterized protein LOC143788576 [Ranitomeya variabilis]|uniref:uncharacterized protein LOC143788576 n=1 Tax=Ranitomeya variabilis TaxID=490064 RepID=UPI004056F4FE
MIFLIGWYIIYKVASSPLPKTPPDEAGRNRHLSKADHMEPENPSLQESLQPALTPLPPHHYRSYRLTNTRAPATLNLLSPSPPSCRISLLTNPKQVLQEVQKKPT